MSLANGRPYLAIPGPSVIPDRVLRAMHQGSPNIYEGPLIDMVASLWPDLRQVAGTTGHVAIYIGNGHAGWEAANANLFSRGDKALVLAVGQFGLLGQFGPRDGGRGRGAGLRQVLARRHGPGRGRAARRCGHEIKAVLTTHVDTASSIKTDIPALRAAMDAAGHPALWRWTASPRLAATNSAWTTGASM
jgi:alanine-glyoxylate transaminase / serine-glyoxylate transaminase / serine-pyruvate transaminase